MQLLCYIPSDRQIIGPALRQTDQKKKQLINAGIWRNNFLTIISHGCCKHPTKWALLLSVCLSKNFEITWISLSFYHMEKGSAEFLETSTWIDFEGKLTHLTNIRVSFTVDLCACVYNHLSTVLGFAHSNNQLHDWLRLRHQWCHHINNCCKLAVGLYTWKQENENVRKIQA